jgi:hypothetical protein
MYQDNVVSHHKWEARFQRAADATFWPRVAGGCHLARDTTATIESSGFQIETCERFQFSPVPPFPPDPMILGTARRP